MACIGENITERKKTENLLLHMSMHDRLTGLYNRAFFDEELNRLSLGRQLPISIIMADVDGLKNINDTFGHAAGDRLIKLAAHVLLQAFRTEDVVARIGGDEFAVLLSSTAAPDAEEAIARVRKFQDEANAVNDEFILSISLGVATAKSGKGLVNAMKLSDERMYINKYSKKERLTPICSGLQQEMIFQVRSDTSNGKEIEA
jgi:diguanylate cyclase (GGDEF)-like protein